MAQALVRYLLAQKTRIDGEVVPLFAGMFAIFGHGNVAGLGEALAQVRKELPTLRPHNEQGMAHAAIAYAKALKRRRMMACTTSIGPGATNMVTAAALAHVNRLPVLLLPGETFAGRLPDPVLQQIEVFSDPTVTANDCFRPVSRYWDRIMRPAQLLRTLPQAVRVLTDPAECGPVTLCLPQDVQTEAWDYPEDFFDERLHAPFRAGPDAEQLREAAALIRGAHKPLIVAGGGVVYSEAEARLSEFARTFRIPVAETQAGKGALDWEHPFNVGALGVTGSSAANALVADADLVIALGTRLSDFTSGSGALFARPGLCLLAVNACGMDSVKYGARPLQCDILRGLDELAGLLTGYAPDGAWAARAEVEKKTWNASIDAAVAPGPTRLPGDAQVIGVVNASIRKPSTVVCAAGGLPGELHKLWRASANCGYHLEYGYSCMGYEIAGGLGVKMALPGREVIVMVGDGSYLMLNSEISTSVALGMKLVIVLLDNGGFGCINRLQKSTGSDSFNNLLGDGGHAVRVDFAAHAAALGAKSEHVGTLDELAKALDRAYAARTTSVIVIETDPAQSTAAGGAWWDVPVPEVSAAPAVRAAFDRYKTDSSKRG
jgi:3D-(3,5/4)-trihydroxycyclohexane-1,2-dione acylhydrolase (decyclizing)